MNELIQRIGDDEADYLNDIAELFGESRTYENNMSSADWNLGFDIEPRFYFINYAVGLSVGYHSVNAAEANIESPEWIETEKFSLKLKCIPILGTFYYRYNMSDTMCVLLGAGGGYYLGTMELEGEGYEFDLGAGEVYQYQVSKKFKGNALGAHARFELNYILHPFTLYGGVEGRYVKFSEFKDGSDTIENVDGGKLSAQLTGVFFYFGASVLL